MAFKLIFVILNIIFLETLGVATPAEFIGNDDSTFADDLEEDYVSEAIPRLLNGGNSGHGRFKEEFQRFQLRKNGHGEGRVSRDGVCGREDEIHKSLKSFDCALPVIRTVRLKSPGPNYEIVPSVVHVKRCSGHCHHPKTCLPKTKRTISFPVYQIDKSKEIPSRSCVEFELDQHEECRCGCAIKRNHCTEKQVYDEARCACVCQNFEEKRDCLEKAYSNTASEVLARYWDDAMCECACIPKGCRRGVWVPSLCKCVNIQAADDNDNDLF